VLRIELALQLEAAPAAGASAASPANPTEEVLALAMVVDSAALYNGADAELGDLTPGETELVVAVTCPGQPAMRFTAPFTLAAGHRAAGLQQRLEFVLPVRVQPSNPCATLHCPARKFLLGWPVLQGLQPEQAMAWLAENHLQVTGSA
jgi:hypothetical protein